MAKTVLHLVQEIATPHSNVMVAALKARKDVELHLWYCTPRAAKYGWKDDLTHAVQQANLYKPNSIDWAMLRQIIFNPSHKVLMVGWSNPSTRALFIALCLLRRPFGMWFDMPEDKAPRSKAKHVLREVFYRLLRNSRATVFAVGRTAVEYFKARGFDESRVVNLPIFVEVDKDRTAFASQRDSLRKRYGAGKNDILVVGGSRLVFDKGFDLPITAIGALPPALRKRFRLVVVGQGEELENMKQLALDNEIADQVYFPGWLAYPDFQALIAAGEAFIHPARFDAWGSTIFAHAIGVPVVGSIGAGSAYDRIEQGKNGWLFDPTKPATLVEAFETLAATDEKTLAKMGKAARKTAEEWQPSNSAATVIEKMK